MQYVTLKSLLIARDCLYKKYLQVPYHREVSGIAQITTLFLPNEPVLVCKLYASPCLHFLPR